MLDSGSTGGGTSTAGVNTASEDERIRYMSSIAKETSPKSLLGMDTVWMKAGWFELAPVEERSTETKIHSSSTTVPVEQKRQHQTPRYS